MSHAAACMPMGRACWPKCKGSRQIRRGCSLLPILELPLPWLAPLSLVVGCIFEGRLLKQAVCRTRRQASKRPQLKSAACRPAADLWASWPHMQTGSLPGAVHRQCAGLPGLACAHAHAPTQRTCSHARPCAPMYVTSAHAQAHDKQLRAAPGRDPGHYRQHGCQRRPPPPRSRATAARACKPGR